MKCQQRSHFSPVALAMRTVMPASLASASTPAGALPPCWRADTSSQSAKLSMQGCAELAIQAMAEAVAEISTALEGGERAVEDAAARDG